MRIIKAIGCVLLAAAMVFAGGCRLADPNFASAERDGDKMIGYFITREHLDLFDFEAYLSDNAPKHIGGGEIDAASSVRYSGRIYAAIEDGRITFEGLEGEYAVVAEISSEDESGFYITCMASDSVCETRFGAGDNVTIEGAIYVRPGYAPSFYFNPVYQDAERNIYVTTGQGMVGNAWENEGGMMSHKSEETRSVTENGATREQQFSITIEIKVKNPTVATGSSRRTRFALSGKKCRMRPGYRKNITGSSRRIVIK